MKQTTLCYIQMDGRFLVLHRTKKKNDENADMYIGLGGHFEKDETPEECMLREVYEEAGIRLEDYAYRGIVYFHSDVYEDEEMHLFSASSPLCVLPECDEGELCLLTREELLASKMWAGDRIFLSLLFDGADFFKLSLRYEGDKLVFALLNGSPAELFELLDEQGSRTGRFKERSLVHRDGDFHETAHIWIYKKESGGVELLLQKRAQNKDSYPGCYDISSAGHLARGEGSLEAARRELYEELGIRAKESELRFIGYFDHLQSAFFNGKPFLDNEHSALYLYNGSALNAGALALQKDEVESVRWFEAAYIDAHIDEANFCIIREEWNLVIDAIERL